MHANGPREPEKLHTCRAKIKKITKVRWKLPLSYYFVAFFVFCLHALHENKLGDHR